MAIEAEASHAHPIILIVIYHFFSFVTVLQNILAFDSMLVVDF